MEWITVLSDHCTTSSFLTEQESIYIKRERGEGGGGGHFLSVRMHSPNMLTLVEAPIGVIFLDLRKQIVSYGAEARRSVTRSGSKHKF